MISYNVPQALQLLKKKDYYSELIAKMPGFNMSSSQLQAHEVSPLPASARTSSVRIPASTVGAVHDDASMEISPVQPQPAQQPPSLPLQPPPRQQVRTRRSRAAPAALHAHAHAKRQATTQRMDRLRTDDYRKGENAREQVRRRMKHAAKKGVLLTRDDAIAADLSAHGKNKGLTRACYEPGYGVPLCRRMPHEVVRRNARNS